MKKLSEILGMEKKEITDRADSFNRMMDEGYNEAINELDEFVMDEEKMSQIISDEWYDQLGKNINRGQSCKLFSEKLRDNADKWIVRGRK